MQIKNVAKNKGDKEQKMSGRNHMFLTTEAKHFLTSHSSASREELSSLDLTLHTPQRSEQKQ